MEENIISITYDEAKNKQINGRTWDNIFQTQTIQRLIKLYNEDCFKSFFDTITDNNSMPLAVFNLKQAGVGHLDCILAFFIFFNIGLKEARDWYELMPLYVPLAEQPTDADLKKQLLSILDEKQEFHKG